MSVLDLPPLLGLVGSAQSSFVARRGGRVLAGVATAVAAGCWAITWLTLRGGAGADRTRVAALAVAPVALFAVASVGLAVRTARIWIDAGGVRWGWRSLHVRMERERLARAEIYRDGVGLVAKKGSRWFLAARDWSRFELMTREIERAGMPIERIDGRAPFRARLQSYGRVLDSMMIATMIASLAVVALA
jgi:hypothetical protein